MSLGWWLETKISRYGGGMSSDDDGSNRSDCDITIFSGSYYESYHFLGGE